LLRAFREESQGQRSLSGRTAQPSIAVTPAFISHYRIVEWLGSGGSGDVYRAVRTIQGTEHEVALKKFASRPGREYLSHFIREHRILAAAEPANVAQFLDAGVAEDGRPFVVSELVAGTPVTDYCDQERLSLADRLRLMRSVCRAVQTAHQQLIVHLDLKPSNILVTQNGRVKLLDFGTAKLVDAARQTPGTPSLTLLYASPEQLRGGPPSVACDIYSLGIILYELASGLWPFERPDNIASVADRAVGHCDPLPLDRKPTPENAAARRQRPERLVRQLRGELDAICRKAIAHDPRERYATVAELEMDLRRYQTGEPVFAHSTDPTYLAGKFVRRNAWGLAAVVTVLLSIGTAALVR
jgi:serine/threonine-protein kinase